MVAFQKFLNGLGAPYHQLWEHIMNKTLRPLRENDIVKSSWRSPTEVLTRAKFVREWFLEAIGGLPETDVTVRAQPCNTIERRKYVIRKLLIETFPKVLVSSLLYIPHERERQAPAILFVCGHHLAAKAAPEYQRVCHDLASNGFVVLAIDPTGQGERVSFYDPDKESSPSFWGVWEHAYQGLQCVLTGTSIARYFLYDALRCIDYLQSLPDVDAERIGVTGNSGGGTQTTLLCMSGDPRIKVAVPCTYVTSREHYVQTGQPQDAEQIQFGMNKHAIDYDDMFLPFAPRPLLIGAVKDDFFNPEGTAHTFARLRRHYTVLGKPECVECVFTPGQHRYSRELRTAAVNWFLKHLTTRTPDFVSSDDETIDCLPEETLWCSEKGHLRSQFPEINTPFHLNVQTAPNRVQVPPETLRGKIVDVLGIRERIANPCELFPRVAQTQNYKDIEISSVVFISEPGIWLTGCLIVPPNSRDVITVYLNEQGTKSLDRFLDTYWQEVERGEAAFLADVRGTGSIEMAEMSAYGGPFPSSMLNTASWTAWLAYCAGEALLGMRVYDVLRCIQYLRDHRNYLSIGIHAVGIEPTLWAYFAAALDERIHSVRLIGMLPAFEEIVRTERYRRDVLPTIMVHGILQEFDLPDLLPLFENRHCEIDYVDACDKNF